MRHPGLPVATSGARGIVIRNSSRVALTSPDSSVTTAKATAIEIADTGVGIDESLLKKMLEPYGEEDDGSGRRFEGGEGASRVAAGDADEVVLGVRASSRDSWRPSRSWTSTLVPVVPRSIPITAASSLMGAAPRSRARSTAPGRG